MKIPSKIVIKGKVWQIGYKWKLHDEKLGACDALVDWVEKTIWLDRSLPREDKIKALVHEIIHVLLDEYHLHQEGGIGSNFAEEVICSGVSEGLLEIFNLKFKQEAFNVVSRSRK